MPALGMTMEEGKIVRWCVNEGDRVARGQILLEIESEKVAYEVESPADGVVGRLLVEADSVVPVGTPLVSILVAGESPAAAPETTPASQRMSPALASTPSDAAPSAISARGASAAAEGAARQRLSPRARKLAETLGVGAAALVGSGPGGTVVERDIREAAARTGQGEREPAGAPPAEAGSVLRAFTAMRRTIAERMAHSAQEAPHFFLAVEVDGGALLEYRRANAARLEADTGLKLTVTDLLLCLTAQTLRAHRALNASYTAEGIREWNDVNLGVAVAVDGGLVVPVIRRAEAKSVAELMRARHDLVSRARTRKLTVDDLRGGTFTLSNLGSFGVDFFTSILNPSEAGILSIGSLRERPAVVDGRVVARPGMIVGLTIDHRVTDGAAGAQFLQDLKSRAEAGRLGE